MLEQKIGVMFQNSRVSALCSITNMDLHTKLNESRAESRLQLQSEYI